MAADAVAEEAIKQVSSERNLSMAFPPLETRQKMFRDQRDADLRKVADHFQARQKKVQSVREATVKFLQESRAEEITVLLARARDGDHRLTVQEGSARTLAIFQNTAFYDDFTEARRWSCEPERITIKELFARLGELLGQGIDSLTLDRCPRCQDVRQVLRLAQIASEADLLRHYGAIVAGKHVLIEEKLDAALHETDPAKRLAAFQHIIEHMDPAHAADCHCVSGEDAVVDSNQNLEDAALRAEITTLNKFFGRTAVKQIAWCFHPATSFAFIAEDFQSALPDRAGIGVGELFRQLFSRCWYGPVIKITRKTPHLHGACGMAHSSARLMVRST